VAALLHDIGKGGLTAHSIEGEPIAREIATRMGFDAPAVELIATLVRWHLLLAETATTRDPDDPATVELVTSRLPSPQGLQLLLALSEADARATSPKAWSSWRSGLVLDLGRRALAALGNGAPLPPVEIEDVPLPDDLGPDDLAVTVDHLPPGDGGGARVTVIGVDRVGLLADVAAALALLRIPVRAARIWSQADHGVSVWEVAEEYIDPAVLRSRYRAVRSEQVDPGQRLGPSSDALLPTVVVRPEASDQATVLEVRAADRRGVIYLVCRALARLGVSVRSAHVDTLGPQAVDVFYVQEASAGALSETRAAEAAHAVRAALSGDG
jgi:[protein-PII] uridylyltransferase